MNKLSRLYDILRFLNTLNFRRMWNVVCVYTTFYLSKWKKKPVGEFKPFMFTFEPTTSCNLRCPECPSGLRRFQRPTGSADLEVYNEFIRQIAPTAVYLYLYFQGEPFLHKEFLEMIRIAKLQRIYTVTSTNGHYLSPKKAEEIVRSGLDRIIISIDGISQEVYQQYRVGGQVSKVMEGARNLIEAKKKLKSTHPYIIFQTLVVGPNEHEIPLLRKLANEMGADNFVLKTAQIYNYENGSNLIPKNEKYSRYKFRPDGKYEIKSQWQNQCWKLWHSTVCTFDGQIIPCCFDKDAKYSMGNITEQLFEEIWKNDKYKSFRRRLWTNRKEIDICKNCSEGLDVWI